MCQPIKSHFVPISTWCPDNQQVYQSGICFAHDAIYKVFKISKHTENLSVLICTMEHVMKYHIAKLNKKSTFKKGIDVDQLIQDVLAHPLVKRQHETKSN